MAHHASFWIFFVVAWVVLIAAAVVANHRRAQAKPPTPVKPASRTKGESR